MSDDEMTIRSRIIGSSSLIRRNSTSDTPPANTSHDYIPIIVMTVIVVAIILILLILAQYTRVLDRKKPTTGLDDPESAQNAGKIEKLNQKAPNQSFKSWREKSEDISSSVKQGTTFVVCAICLETLQEDDTIRLLSCAHIFHSLCLAKWFLKRHDTCPLCKACFMSSSEKSPKPLQIPERTHTR
ncbi:hypothetical protein TrVGV298_006224 [Trichoderma virens]|nr:hypothetical protein TrVGV298_006224 [Trichoderma virens]